jgi:hypothetical protein
MRSTCQSDSSASSRLSLRKIFRVVGAQRDDGDAGLDVPSGHVAAGADPAGVGGDRVVADVEAGRYATPTEVVDGGVVDDHRERADRVIQREGNLEGVRGLGHDPAGDDDPARDRDDGDDLDGVDPLVDVVPDEVVAAGDVDGEVAGVGGRVVAAAGVPAQGG